MSTATAEPTFEALVQQPERQVLFISKRDELRLVHTGRYPMVVPNTGQRLGETRGVTVSFAPNGEFRCPVEGEVTIMDPGGAGKAVMYAEDTVNEKGEHVQGLLSWLESHHLCGDPNEGFYRVDPKAPPLGQQEQKRLMDAATDWDVETLERIIEQERAGWNREDIIEIAQGSIDRIHAAAERFKAEAEAAEKADAEKPKGK